jgi:proton-dependent oligopeptide transporter, POT family
MPSTVAPETPDRSDNAFFGHPRGLSTLFFTEMWERFSYYGMRAFLVFYMTAPVAEGGLGFSLAVAGIIYGMYTASVYLMGVPGGWIADRFLGLRRAVLIGGALIMSGHAVLALPIEQGFYLGLGLVVLGTGLLKPNISALVGQLYGPNDIRRDSGYSLYYMGINIGAFAAPLVCGYLAQDDRFRYWLEHSAGIDPNSAWHIGFGAAAVGMFLGLVQYVIGVRHLKGAGETPTPPKNAAEASRNKLILGVILASVVGLPALVYGLYDAGILSDKEAVGNFFGGFLVLLTVALFTGLYIVGCQNTEERRRLIVIFVLFLGATMFWACFDQAGSVLNLFADTHTRRELVGFSFPASWLQSVNSLFVITLAPVFAGLWVWMARRKREPSAPAKFGAGLVLVGAGFAVMLPAASIIEAGNGPVSPGFLIGLYLMHTFAELCLSPVGLSSMSKLAPARWGGLVMGIWFLASANGSFLAGRAVGLSEDMEPSNFFTLMIFLPVALGAIFFALVPPIRRMLARNETGEKPAGH